MTSTLWIYAPLLLSAAFGASAAPLSRRLPPRVASWLLSAGGATAAAASSAAIALLAFVFVAQAPLLVAQGHWSDRFLRAHAPDAAPVGAAATLAVALLSARFLRVAGRRLAALRDARRLAAALPGGAELAVLPSSAAQAFAVPGRPGRIVATSGILRGLDADQRRALLAHERAHLVHRHHLHQTVLALAVAINPLLARLPRALALSCERWADEDAAHENRRSTVAAALRAAAATGPSHAPAVVLAAGGGDVLLRVAALDAAPPRLAPWRLAVPTALLLAAGIAVAVAMHDVERLFEAAQSMYPGGHR